MKPFRVVHEDETHFVVHDGKVTFPVAKGALSPKLIEKIRAFSGGGEVLKASEGVEVPEIWLSGVPGSPPPNPDEAAIAGHFANPDAAANPQEPGWRSRFDADATQSRIADEARIRAEAATPASALVSPITEALFGDQPKPYQAAQPGAVQPGTAQGPFDFYGQAGTPVFSKTAGAGTEQAPGDSATGPGSYSGLDEYGRAVKQGEEGIKARATATAAEMKADAAVYGKLARDREAMNTEYQQRMQAHDARIADLSQQIQNGSIDPNHFWHSASTGQKISASIGLILGGIGAGLTRGPNYAFETINKAIDRDMEAQKFDLNKKASLLSQYMQQGHNLMTAHQLAKSDLQDVAASQILKNANQFGGAKAKADAEIAAAKLHMDASTGRGQVILQGLQIDQTKMGLAVSRLQMGALQTLYGQDGKGPAGSQGTFGVKLPTQVIPFLPKDTQEKLVQVAPGEFRPAKDKTIADKAQEALLEADKVETMASDLFKVAKQHPFATWWPKENQNAQALSKFLSVILFRSEGGINRYNDKEREIANEIITNPSSFWASVSGGNEGRTQFLKKLLWSNRASTVNNFTIGPKLPMEPPTTR